MTRFIPYAETLPDAEAAHVHRRDLQTVLTRQRDRLARALREAHEAQSAIEALETELREVRP